MKRADGIFAAILLAIVIGFLAVATQLNSTAARMPFIVGIFTLLCLIAYFLFEYRQPDKPSKKHGGEAEDEDKSEPKLAWNDPRVWGWLVVLLVLSYALGLIVGLSLLTILFYRFAAKGTWRGAILFGVAEAAFLYLVFVAGFQEQLYEGLLAEWLYAL